jgi:hypothetical protein
MGYNEKFTGQGERLSGHPDSMHTEKTVGSEIQDLPMKMSHGETTDERGALNDNMMTSAVKHLNRETQRGEHAPMVGGYLHDHKMR